jgi:hypothetical protein
MSFSLVSLKSSVILIVLFAFVYLLFNVFIFGVCLNFCFVLDCFIFDALENDLFIFAIEKLISKASKIKQSKTKQKFKHTPKINTLNNKYTKANKTINMTELFKDTSEKDIDNNFNKD